MKFSAGVLLTTSVRWRVPEQWSCGLEAQLPGRVCCLLLLVNNGSFGSWKFSPTVSLYIVSIMPRRFFFIFAESGNTGDEVCLISCMHHPPPPSETPFLLPRSPTRTESEFEVNNGVSQDLGRGRGLVIELPWGIATPEKLIHTWRRWSGDQDWCRRG